MLLNPLWIVFKLALAVLLPPFGEEQERPLADGPPEVLRSGGGTVGCSRGVVLLADELRDPARAELFRQCLQQIFLRACEDLALENVEGCEEMPSEGRTCANARRGSYRQARR